MIYVVNFHEYIKQMNKEYNKHRLKYKKILDRLKNKIEEEDSHGLQ